MKTPCAKVNLKQLTPVLIVERIECCLPFWIDRLGFCLTNELLGSDAKLIFASIEKDGIEIMYQTRASVAADQPAVAMERGGHSIALYISVDDIDLVEPAMIGAAIIKARHTTFYGSTEIYVSEPGGNTVGFAQMMK